MMIFLHIQKTAGTSFRFILENTFGVRHCHTNHTQKPVFTQQHLNFARKVFPGLRSMAGHNLIDPLALDVPNPFYMTLLREPISRVISHYQANVRGGQKGSFEEMLQTKPELENLHVKLMAGERNVDKAKRFLEKCDMVALTEKFDLSVHLLARVSPCKLRLHYKRKTVAPEYSVRDSIRANPALLDMAREYNKLDLELYSFGVNEVFPKLCQRAGLDPSAPVPAYGTCKTDMKPIYQIGKIYNRLVFRQICKVAL